jgi:hypothetical protein
MRPAIVIRVHGALIRLLPFDLQYHSFFPGRHLTIALSVSFTRLMLINDLAFLTIQPYSPLYPFTQVSRLEIKGMALL